MQFLDALLAGDRLARSLARAGVGTGALAAYRQVPAMPAATVADDILQTLNVLLNLAAKRAFDHVRAVDDVHDAADFIFREFTGLLQRVDVGFLQDDHRIDRANAIDITQRDANLLFEGDIDTGNTRHEGSFETTRIT